MLLTLYHRSSRGDLRRQAHINSQQTGQQLQLQQLNLRREEAEIRRQEIENERAELELMRMREEMRSRAEK